MTKEQAINVIQELIKGAGLAGDDTIIEALDMAQKALTIKGCVNCRYEAAEPWDLPCCLCSHNHKDYFTEN